MATLVYLQTICDQLKDALELGKGMNVAALIDAMPGDCPLAYSIIINLKVKKL